MSVATCTDEGTAVIVGCCSGTAIKAVVWIVSGTVKVYVCGSFGVPGASAAQNNDLNTTNVLKDVW